ncbi:MAG: DUF465 domain-containing protein [Pseudomonadales bacterium]|nr:DUF465 domain-containing protein [Pseudomonadales bacterium]
MLLQNELLQYKSRGKDYHTASSARVVIYLNQTELQHWLDELRVEHRDLDVVIKHLQDSHHHDNMRVQRLKRRKLKLKDMITRLESGLIPDLDA